MLYRPMPKLYFLIGLPGSGKTIFAEELHEVTGAFRLTLGDVRRGFDSVYGKDNYEPHKMVNKAYEIVLKTLNDGNDCIFDATNLSARNRRHFVYHVLRGIECKKIAYIVATPYDQCVKDCYYGKELVKQGYEKWQTPGIWEGWDEIWLYYKKPEWIGYNGTPSEFQQQYQDYDQGNSHHGLTLGEHSMQTMLQMKLLNVKPWKYEALVNAALLHDCGKPLCRGVKPDGDTTYYNHHHIGAYEALFYDYRSDVDVSYISALIGHHMDPFFWDKDFNLGKYKAFYGEAFYDDVMLIHQADKSAR